MHSPVFATSRARTRVIGIREQFMARVREARLDDQSQPVVRYVSESGGEPLRDLLRRARPREEVILGSHCPFDEAGPFREYGPIYVSGGFSPVEISPEELFVGDYFATELILRRYDHRLWIAEARRIHKIDAVEVIDEWLTDPTTKWVDARFHLFGCYACRFTRST